MGATPVVGLDEVSRLLRLEVDDVDARILGISRVPGVAELVMVREFPVPRLVLCGDDTIDDIQVLDIDDVERPVFVGVRPYLRLPG